MVNPIFVRIPRTVVEVGGCSKISELVKDLKPLKILVTTDKGVITAGLTKGIESSLRAAGYQFDVFDGCQPKNDKIKNDGFVKSPLCPLIVIPAKAGIQSFQVIMDSRFRGNDSIFDFLRFHQK